MIKDALSVLANVAQSAEKKAKRMQISLSSNDDFKEIIEDRGKDLTDLETVDGQTISYEEIGTMYVDNDHFLVASQEKDSRDELRQEVESIRHAKER